MFPFLGGRIFDCNQNMQKNAVSAVPGLVTALTGASCTLYKLKNLKRQFAAVYFHENRIRRFAVLVFYPMSMLQVEVFNFSQVTMCRSQFSHLTDFFIVWGICLEILGQTIKYCDLILAKWDYRPWYAQKIQNIYYGYVYSRRYPLLRTLEY